MCFFTKAGYYLGADLQAFAMIPERIFALSNEENCLLSRIFKHFVGSAFMCTFTLSERLDFSVLINNDV